MNAVELHLPDGRSAGVWFCGACRFIHSAKELVDKCCTPNVCHHCGAECEKHWLACKACRDSAERIKEHQRFTNAEKVREFDGAVFSEGHGHNEGYFPSLADFIEWWEDDDHDGAERPAYVWACDSRPCCELDCGKIIEDATQDTYDDYDSGGLAGVEELKAALDKFNELNKDDVTWTPNFKLAVLL